MKSGQVITKWWQDLVAGRLRTPQDIVAAAHAENPDPARASERFFYDAVDDQEAWDVPQRLKAPSFILSEAHIRQGERADWQHCDRRLMRWAAVFVELARMRGVPLYAHCAFRTEAEQAKVNSSGNSRAAFPRSPHNIGEAVDIVHGVYHWNLTRQEWAFLAVLGWRALDLVNRDLKKADQLQLTWGGTFKTLWDPAHWEITDYRSRIERLAVGPPVRMMPRKVLATVRL